MFRDLLKITSPCQQEVCKTDKLLVQSSKSLIQEDKAKEISISCFFLIHALLTCTHKPKRTYLAFYPSSQFSGSK